VRCIIFGVLSFLIILIPTNGFSQDNHVANVLKSDNTTSDIDKKRLAWSLGLGGAAYTTASITLYDRWYRDYPQGKFHTFNDLGEWRGVDKAGHIFSGYFQSHWAYLGWRWVGMNKKEAIWAGAATGFLAQTTIEVMDGFSEEWGFSIPDFSANLLGIGSFAVQQAIWDEQRILLKTSSTPIDYEERYGQVAANRANELFGDGFLTRYLKDYNAQTTWASVNLKSFFPDTSLPDWLNVAVGYGAENMFGGFSNDFEDDELLDLDHRRYSQFYISLDADLSKIETASPFWRTLLDIVNVIKIPFSAIEINTLGEVRFHVIRF